MAMTSQGSDDADEFGGELAFADEGDWTEFAPVNSPKVPVEAPPGNAPGAQAVDRPAAVLSVDAFYRQEWGTVSMRLAMWELLLETFYARKLRSVENGEVDKHVVHSFLELAGVPNDMATSLKSTGIKVAEDRRATLKSLRGILFPADQQIVEAIIRLLRHFVIPQAVGVCVHANQSRYGADVAIAVRHVLRFTGASRREAERLADDLEEAIAASHLEPLLTDDRPPLLSVAPDDGEEAAHRQAGEETAVSSRLRTRRMIARAAKIGAFGIVGGAVFALTGGLAAHAVAGAVANLGGGASTTAAAVGATGGAAAAGVGTVQVVAAVSATKLALAMGAGGVGVASLKGFERTKGASKYELDVLDRFGDVVKWSQQHLQRDSMPIRVAASSSQADTDAVFGNCLGLAAGRSNVVTPSRSDVAVSHVQRLVATDPTRHVAVFLENLTGVATGGPPLAVVVRDSSSTDSDWIVGPPPCLPPISCAAACVRTSTIIAGSIKIAFAIDLVPLAAAESNRPASFWLFVNDAHTHTSVSAVPRLPGRAAEDVAALLSLTQHAIAVNEAPYDLPFECPVGRGERSVIVLSFRRSTSRTLNITIRQDVSAQEWKWPRMSATCTVCAGNSHAGLPLIRAKLGSIQTTVAPVCPPPAQFPVLLSHCYLGAARGGPSAEDPSWTCAVMPPASGAGAATSNGDSDVRLRPWDVAAFSISVELEASTSHYFSVPWSRRPEPPAPTVCLSLLAVNDSVAGESTSTAASRVTITARLTKYKGLGIAVSVGDNAVPHIADDAQFVFASDIGRSSDVADVMLLDEALQNVSMDAPPLNGTEPEARTTRDWLLSTRPEDTRSLMSVTLSPTRHVDLHVCSSAPAGAPQQLLVIRLVSHAVESAAVERPRPAAPVVRQVITVSGLETVTDFSRGVDRQLGQQWMDAVATVRQGHHPPYVFAPSSLLTTLRCWDDGQLAKFTSLIGAEFMYAGSDMATDKAKSVIKSKVKAAVKQELLKQGGTLAAGTAAYFAATALIALPGTAMSLCNLIDNAFASLSHRSEDAGQQLAEQLLREASCGRPITLIGYGFGAVVVLSCLTHLAAARAPLSAMLVEHAILLGLPVAVPSASWGHARRVVAGSLINGYSRSDLLLSLLQSLNDPSSRIATDASVPGLNPISVEGIANVDVSAVVERHAHYCTRLPSVLAAAMLAAGHLGAPPRDIVSGVACVVPLDLAGRLEAHVAGESFLRGNEAATGKGLSALLASVEQTAAVVARPSASAPTASAAGVTRRGDFVVVLLTVNNLTRHDGHVSPYSTLLLIDDSQVPAPESCNWIFAPPSGTCVGPGQVLVASMLISSSAATSLTCASLRLRASSVSGDDCCTVNVHGLASRPYGTVDGPGGVVVELATDGADGSVPSRWSVSSNLVCGVECHAVTLR